MNKNVLAAIIAVIVIGGGVAWYATTHKNKQASDSATNNAQQMSTDTHDEESMKMDEDGDEPANMSSDASMSDKTDTTTTTPSTDTAMTPGVKEFTVTGSSFKFEPSSLTVNKGDKVKITFKNSGGFHDWVLDGYDGVKTKQINGGQSDTIEFTADKAGTFEYYCSVGTHRQMGMKGTLVVK